MDSPHALPLPPSAISLHGLDTHFATGRGVRQEQAQVALHQLAPGSAVGSRAAMAPIRVREWPVRNTPAQFAAPLLAEANFASRQAVITLQIQAADPRDRLDEYLCSFWDTRKLFFMHPHDMAAHGLNEGDSVLVSAAARTLQMHQMVRLRVVPYDLPRGTARGYFGECRALLADPSSTARPSLDIRVHVVSAAH